MGIDLIAGAQAVAPAMKRTIIASLKKRRGEVESLTDDPGYTETLQLMRQLLHFTAISYIDDIQHITNRWIPHPPSVIVTDVEVPTEFYPEAARHIQANLGPVNLKRIGKTWWQWRRPGSVVRAEWVEMKSDYLERKAKNDLDNKVMFYVHGGAYFFGGIGHGPQIQRHARKLHGRVFAPRYRLAPQFPFPCAVQDVLSAYLYLLTIQHPSTIVIAGDSAGGGLCVALLIILRDQGLPLPAGASLISPWVDLTHSFPSVTIPSDLDYVPGHGFHARPSLSWPPPTSDEMTALKWPRHPGAEPDPDVTIDGQRIVLKDQIQMYAQNTHLQMPLVSGILAASLGGLCPLQVIVGGSEILRDEQIYLAHKAADPASYAPCPEILAYNGDTMDDVTRYPPTDVQLLVFDECPHAAPTLGHTRGAKHEYRSVAQFAAWALATAQKADIEIEDDASLYSFTMSEPRGVRCHTIAEHSNVTEETIYDYGEVGKAGDPLPRFVNHMIRQLVDVNGRLFPLRRASELRACTFPASEIGLPKQAALKGWFKYKEQVDIRFESDRKKVWKQRIRNAAIGYVTFPDGEVPPPSALAGRRVVGSDLVEIEKPRGQIGKSIFGILYSKYDRDAPSEAGGTMRHARRKTVTYNMPRFQRNLTRF